MSFAESETGKYGSLATLDAPPGITPPLPTAETPEPTFTASSPEAVFSSEQFDTYKYMRFPSSMRKRVRREQKDRCAYCGKICRGHTWDEPILAIHHVIPSKLGGDKTRTNAVGLCADECHPFFDRLVFEEGKTFFQVLMEEGREYHPSKL